jgi:hypothetical protein
MIAPTTTSRLAISTGASRSVVRRRERCIAFAVLSEADANICSIQMAYPGHLRERARELRVTKKLSLDEIAERLALPKTTVYLLFVFSTTLIRTPTGYERSGPARWT